MWCVIIVSSLLGLRHDEFHKISFADFLPALFEVPQATKSIEALAINVFGKTDPRWFQMKLYADHTCPEFCPVRALGIYMYLTGTKGGYLFPTPQELLNPPTDGVYKTCIDYKNFLNALKELCQNVLPPRDDLKIGCHTFRKTFYLLAVFGDANAFDLQTCGRHRSVENSIRYRKSALTLKQIADNFPNPANKVSKWRSILVDSDSGGHAVLIASLGGNVTIQPSEVGEYFVYNILELSRSNPMARNQQFLVHKAETYVVKTSANAHFQAFNKANVDPEKRGENQLLPQTLLPTMKSKAHLKILQKENALHVRLTPHRKGPTSRRMTCPSGIT